VLAVVVVVVVVVEQKAVEYSTPLPDSLLCYRAEGLVVVENTDKELFELQEPVGKQVVVVWAG